MHVALWKLKRLFVIILLLASTLFFTTPSEAAPGGNVTISNVSPANESIAIEIIGNDPSIEWTGYTNISFTLTDQNGGSDMEFYLNVSVNGTWVNRLHLTSQDSGSWYQHEDEFSYPNTTYHWNVSYRDGTEDFLDNVYHFRSEAKPDPPDTPTPANGTMVVKGDVTLKCVVHHPDGALAPSMTVSFHEWPSGRAIGYDNSSLGDGDTATCDTEYNCFYNGTKYYWYAVNHDDEFDSDDSNIWHVQTYYNDTEPESMWYPIGADIWVEESYTDTEPSEVWYTFGGDIVTQYVLSFTNESPSDGTTGLWKNILLSVWVSKSGDHLHYDFTFYTNATVDESWVEMGTLTEQMTNLTVSMPFSDLEWNKTYWWKVVATNETLGTNTSSDILYFKTNYSIEEPSLIWYAIGGDVWVEESYTDTEPDEVWYTLGGDITTQYMISFTNESPSNGTTELWKNVILSAWAYKGGDPIHYDFTFYTNATVDESWVEMGTLTEQMTNLTVSMPFSDLEWNKTYWWKVVATNETLGTNTSSDILYFKTNYSIEEPSVMWFAVGGDIWVESIYTDTEPSAVWYTLGGNITTGAPYKPSHPSPPNGTQAGKHIYPEFSCYVEDPQGYRMNVSFYWANGTLIGTDTFVDSGTRASVPVGWLANYTWYQWYAIANNSPDSNSIETQSDTWWYRAGNQVPTGNFTPWEGATYVAVRRKLVGGTYQHFVRLIWNISDVEGDDIEYNCYVDDPSVGNWNDWISRWHIYDASNGTYYQDEILFNTPVTNYHWRVYLADDYNSSNNYMNFSTLFYFWANYNWTPYRATNGDNILFIDHSQNATDYWWYVNGVLVANASGLNASDTFNMTHKFNISNVYNVTQVVYNTSARIYDSMTRYVYVDRNLSLNRSLASVIAYYGQSPRGNMNASSLCSLLGIASNAWVHKYNATTSQWDSFWVDYQNLTTDFNISLWDALAFAIGTNMSKRVNITDTPDQREAFFSETAALENMSNATQTLTLPAGLNYLCWSDVDNTSSSTISIGLQANDRVYIYGTQTDTWSTYVYGLGGTDFTINAYDIIVLNLVASRTISIDDGF